jgi:hypothetical protein
MNQTVFSKFAKLRRREVTEKKRAMRDIPDEEYEVDFDNSIFEIRFLEKAQVNKRRENNQKFKQKRRGKA